MWKKVPKKKHGSAWRLSAVQQAHGECGHETRGGPRTRARMHIQRSPAHTYTQTCTHARTSANNYFGAFLRNWLKDPQWAPVCSNTMSAFLNFLSKTPDAWKQYVMGGGSHGGCRGWSDCVEE